MALTKASDVWGSQTPIPAQATSPVEDGEFPADRMKAQALLGEIEATPVESKDEALVKRELVTRLKRHIFVSQQGNVAPPVTANELVATQNSSRHQTLLEIARQRLATRVEKANS